MPAKSKEHFWKSQYGKSSKLEEVWRTLLNNWAISYSEMGEKLGLLVLHSTGANLGDHISGQSQWQQNVY